MAESDPQDKRKRTWGEWFSGTKEGNAIASAEYKRGMGINPKAKDISNAEASRSARSMANPTSAPARTAPSGTKLPESKDSKPLRKAAGTYTKSYDKPIGAAPAEAAAPKKVVTPKVKPAKADPVKAAAAKPTSATGTPAKKMTAFERQKARMYEKEGYGGRSMTAAQAKARVETERSYKSPVNGLSFSGKAPSKAPAKAAKGKPLSGSFASMMQGRNVKGSPTYSPSGTRKKGGFKFKDLFKKK